MALGRVHPDALARALQAGPPQPSGRFAPVATPGARPAPGRGASGVFTASSATVGAPAPGPAPPGADARTIVTPSPGAGPPGAGAPGAPSPGLGATPAPSGAHAALAASTSSGDAGALTRALQAAPGADLGGAPFGAYRLRRLLAKGGMGAVFVADHAALGRTVALKVMLQGEQASPEALERFLREARTSAKVNHPNVVPVYEIGQVGAVAFLTMELVEGPSLRQLLKEGGPLPPRRAAALVEQTARGVAAAHHAKVIHRDLKPHNVLVAPGDVAKVMDFGLAKETGAEAAQGLTVSGAILGTPSYMAPEQAGGEKTTARTDVYGLGAILYEALTGKPPFEGPTLTNIITKVLSQDVAPPRALRPQVHRDLETICLKALEKAPARRYPTAAAFADDLRRWLDGEAIEARPVGALERLAKRARRLGRAGLAAAGLAVALAAVMGHVLIVQPRRDAAAAATREAEARRAREAEASRALEAAKAAHRAHVERVAVAQRALEARAAAVRTAEALAEVVAAATDRERADAAAAAALPAGGGQDVPGDRAVDARSVEAIAALALGEASDPPDLDACATAFAAAPEHPAGRAGLALVAAATEDEAGERAADQLLAIGGLPPARAAVLRLGKARHLLRRGDLSAAAAFAEAAAAAAGDATPPALRRLAEALAPLRRATPLPCTQVLGLVPAAPGRPGRVVGLEAGALVVLRIEGGRATREGAPAPLAADVPTPVAVLPLPDGRVLGASLLPEGRGVRLSLDGRSLGDVPRQGRVADPRLVAWAELDGLEATRELVLGIGPNEGDSAVVTVDLAAGTVSTAPLDREGHARRGAGCYLHSLAAGPFGPGGAPRVALAYGSWYGNDLRVLGPGLRAPLASPPLGTLSSVVATDLDRDGAVELVVACHHGEERDPAFLFAPSLAVAGYRETPRGVEVTPRYALGAGGPRPARPRRGFGGEQLVVARRGTTGLAFAQFVRPDAGDRLIVASLQAKEGELVADVPWPREGLGVVAAGDLDGDGDDDLVVARAGEVRVHGLRDAPTLDLPAASPPAPSEAHPARQGLEILRLVGRHRAALRAAREVERALGVSSELDAVQLDLLARADDATFEAELAAFLRETHRPALALLQGRVLRVLRQVRSADPAVWAAARAELVELRKDGSALLAEQADLAWAARVLDVRQGGRAVAVDFRAAPTSRDEPLGNLAASDPHRVRLDPGRGLVATVCRRVPFFAGVPVVVPRGTARLELELSTEGECWRGEAQLGLFRRLEVPGQPPRVEGIGISMTVFQTGDRRELVHDLRPLLVTDDPKTAERLAVPVAWPNLARRRLRIVLEHDALARRARFEVHDLAPGGRQVVREVEGVDAPVGPFLLGVYAPGREGHDQSGGNTAPDAEVRLERAALGHVATEVRGPPAAFQPERDLERWERACGDVVLARRGAPPGLVAPDEVATRLARLVRDAPRLGAAAALAAAELAPARGAAARRAFGEALRRDPVAALRAVEDDGRLLGPAAREGVRDALRDVVADPAAPPRARAAAHALRGEPTEAEAALAAAAPDDAGRADDLYLRVACGVTAPFTAERVRAHEERVAELLALLPGDRPLPEHPHHRPCLWRPLEDVAPAAVVATVKERLEASRDPVELLAWLDRGLALGDDLPAATRASLHRARAQVIPQLGAAMSSYRWRYVDDLRQVVALTPGDAAARLQLAAALVQLALDYEAAGAALRGGPRPPARADLARAWAQLLEPKPFDEDLPRFVEAVTGPDAAWTAFLERLAASGLDPR